VLVNGGGETLIANRNMPLGCSPDVQSGGGGENTLAGGGMGGGGNSYLRIKTWLRGPDTTEDKGGEKREHACTVTVTSGGRLS
jgi:hypothetical protein